MPKKAKTASKGVKVEAKPKVIKVWLESNFGATKNIGTIDNPFILKCTKRPKRYKNVRKVGV